MSPTKFASRRVLHFAAKRSANELHPITDPEHRNAKLKQFRIAVRRTAEHLAKSGIEATVVNARFVKPLDAGLLLALARTKRLIVTVEEAYLAGGFGSAVMELLEENGLLDTVKVVRMGVPDRIITHGDPKLLLAKYGLDADGIYTRVREAWEVLEERRAPTRQTSQK